MTHKEKTGEPCEGATKHDCNDHDQMPDVREEGSERATSSGRENSNQAKRQTSSNTSMPAAHCHGQTMVAGRSNSHQHRMQVRQQIKERSQKVLQEKPEMQRKTLSELNAEAVRSQKGGDIISAVATYMVLLDKARRSNLTHPDLHVIHCNLAEALLELELHEEGLKHAEICRKLAETSLRR